MSKNKSSIEPDSPENSGTGILSLIASPIGNLGDLSPRAVEALQAADLVLAEDTRSYKLLADKFQINTPCTSYHEHNERRTTSKFAEELSAGKNLALLTDAGSPCISDPGFLLVNECHRLGLQVTAVPGPCAAIMALSVSGFPAHRFTFHGFLSRKPGKRGKQLEAMLRADATSIVYESPHRILKTLGQIVERSSSHEVCVCRELTKMHEEILRGTAQSIFETLSERPEQKGEFVLLIYPGDPDETEASEDEDQADAAD